MGKFFKKIAAYKSKILLLIYIAALSIITFKVYEQVAKFYITAEFDELGPISRSMPVYYKGFKIGKTGKITPSIDFKTTGVKIIFNSDMSVLPSNVYVKVRKFDNDTKDHYIEIEYPETPDTHQLKRGDRITGKTEPDINSFMSAQVESGALGAMSTNANKTLSSVEKTSDAARELLNEINNTIKAARPDILAAVNSLAQTTGNTAQITSEMSELSIKLNKSVQKQGVDEAMSNISKTLANIEQISENVNSVTTKLNASMDDINVTTGNVKNITDGLNQTMSKRFGGARVIFGTPVNSNAAGSSPAKNAAGQAPTGASAPAPCAE